MRGRREKVVELRAMVNEDDRDRKHQLRKPVGKCWCDKESENLENSGEIIPDWVVEIEICEYYTGGIDSNSREQNAPRL